MTTASTKSSTPTFSIVIGHDFSILADIALEEAASMAAAAGNATIHVVHVVEKKVPPGDLDQIERETNHRVQPLIASALAKAQADDSIRMFTHIRLGHAAHEIIGLAGDVEADVIVLGTHGRTGVTRLLLGSVAERVMRHASCPVFVMRAKQYPHPNPELVPEPPCPECVAMRQTSGGATWWCEAHGQTRARPHRYSYSGGELHQYHSDGLG